MLRFAGISCLQTGQCGGFGSAAVAATRFSFGFLFPFGLKCAWSTVVVTMNLQYFSEFKRATSLTAIKWLQRRSLLANPLHCGTCN